MEPDVNPTDRTDPTGPTDPADCPRVVVGVDGSEAALTAVRYAVAEARRLGAELEIVHVCPAMIHLNAGPAGYYPLTPTEYRGIAGKILERARKLAEEVSEEVSEQAAEAAVPVRTTLLDGAAGAELATHATGARLLVLGDQRRSLLDRLVTGSVVNAAAKATSAPLVVVPESWRAGGPRGTVAVGVLDVEDCQSLLRAAVAIAAERRARLRVVHAWELPSVYDQLIATRVDSSAWRERNRAALESALKQPGVGDGDVPVEVELVHGQPARALLDASEQCDLLVISRRGEDPSHGHIGGTARAVLRAAHCPILVVAPGGEHAAALVA